MLEKSACNGAAACFRHRRQRIGRSSYHSRRSARPPSNTVLKSEREDQLKPVLKLLSRWLLATLFVVAGVLHFVRADVFAGIVPPYLPMPKMLVYISGVFEIIGGIGLLIPKFRSTARWGLILLLIAVFPANLYMATDPDAFVAAGIPLWALYLRLPLQGVLILWVWWSGKTATK